MPKTLNVKKISHVDLIKQWGSSPFIGTMYIRCNAKGEINWDKAPVYRPQELVGRKNVTVIT